jgi:predicted phage terminase large subunit-like protein
MRPQETDALVRHRVRNDLMSFIRCCDGRYQPSSTGFHDVLAQRYMAAERGELTRQIINTPPQHGKSLLTSVYFPSWFLGRNPGKHVIVASYAQSLSERSSRAARRLVRSPLFSWAFDQTTLEERKAANEWFLSGGGSYSAVGVGSSLTGKPADLLIIDDPHADYASAHSQSEREAVWQWFLSTAMTRLGPGGIVLIIMTRWHVDDLVGRLLSPDRKRELEASGVMTEWSKLRLPAIAEENDPLGRRPGEPLFPERYPLPVLKEQMANLGTYLASALYTGEPVRKGGNYVDPDLINVIALDAVPRCRWIRFWDLAATAKEASKNGDPDFTVGARVGRDEAGNLYITSMVRGQWAWPKARERIQALARSEQIPVAVETVAGFKAALGNLREDWPNEVPLREVGVDRDKLTRALPWFSLMEQGKVFAVAGPWLGEFKAELAAFPGGPHDDQIDAVSGAYGSLSRGVRIFVA